MSDTAAVAARRYVQPQPIAPRPPPLAMAGPIGWIRANLLSSVFNAILTLACILLVVWIVPPLIRFLFVDAVWSGGDRTVCLATAARPEPGACWPFVEDRINFFVYGFYPAAERWRVNVFFALLAFGAAWMMWLDAPRRGLGAVYFFIVMPVVSFFLLAGLPAMGLRAVSTTQWGGVLVTIVVAAVGIVLSLPLGVLLALGRRSAMPMVRIASVVFIEVVRGVPLIAVLFMASVMLPLFVPESWSPDKLLRALIGVALFSAAYMAEVVRGGLQAVPNGQREAAKALGLTYWRTMRLIVLPQALKITIPNIVGSFIALFKDTTLVFVVGIFDFLKTIEAARGDPQWASPVTSTTGYAFAALFYFVFCYGMSRYARFVERRVAAGDRR